MKTYNTNFLSQYINDKANKQELIVFLLKLNCILLSICAVVCIVFLLIIPIIKFSDGSNVAEYETQDYALCLRQGEYARGDLVVFRYGNYHLCKRIVAIGGDTVDIDNNGQVWVNSSKLHEEYLLSGIQVGSYEEGKYPYKVPQGYYFVLNDNRENINDSRNAKIGDVEDDLVVGRVLVKLPRLGVI